MAKLSTFIQKTETGNYLVGAIAVDFELAEMIRVLLDKLYLDTCKICKKPFVVNSPNHEICIRCK